MCRAFPRLILLYDRLYLKLSSYFKALELAQLVEQVDAAIESRLHDDLGFGWRKR